MKEQELEAALAVAGESDSTEDGSAEDGSRDDREPKQPDGRIPLEESTRQQFVDRTESLRELQRSRPGRDHF